MIKMIAFSTKAHSLWNETFDFTDATDELGFLIRVKKDIGSRHPIVKLHRRDGRIFIIMTSEFAAKASLTVNSTLAEVETALN